MKRKKTTDRAVYAVVIVLLGLGIFLLWNKTTFGFLSSFAGSVQKKVSSFLFYTGDTFGSFKYIASAKKGVKVLSEKNMLLESENHALKAENEKLKRAAILKSAREFKSSVICYASVIGANDDGFIYYYTIDRGSDDGISEGDGVVTYEGAVGRVYKVSASTCLVQLLTDIKSAISVRDERSRVAGILSGESYNRCSMNYIPKEEDVKEGDSVVASGLGKSFPEGIRIGTVTDVNKKVDTLSMTVKVKPAVNMMTVEEVMVVRKR